jgi:hypothetical protein
MRMNVFIEWVLEGDFEEMKQCKRENNCEGGQNSIDV